MFSRIQVMDVLVTLVPRLRLGTHCMRGSASRIGHVEGCRKSRRSLQASAFLGGAWERAHLTPAISIAALLLAGSCVCAQDKKPVLQVKEKQIDFRLGDELVTSYHTSGFSKPIFWPVNAPGGVPLTRAWPMEKGKAGESTDHVHQKSAWFVHGDVIPEGMELSDKIRGVEGVDFWSETKGHGQIVCVKVEEPIQKDSQAKVVTHNEWRLASGTKIMDEKRALTFHDFGKARLIVLDIDLHASVAPILFGDTKEGAMGIRINDEIIAQENGKGTIQNAGGKVGERECWGRAAAWCDYSGPINGKTVGLTILADPKNPHPTCWHVRGYGLMAANPFGRIKSLFPDAQRRDDLVRLAKGEHLQLRYGLLLHEGDATTGQVAEHFDCFVKLRGKE
ncbi:MAG: PmoA family protein [Planctomycetes bacterium]|nr:PmoA family protein [Planctomycetota bacterium]